MSFKNIKTSLRFFSGTQKIELIKFLLRKKIDKGFPFKGDPSILDRYNKVFYLHEKGVGLRVMNKTTIQLSFNLNKKKYLANIRPLTSDIDVFISVILGEEYQSIRKLDPRGAGKQVIIDAGANIGFTTLYFHAYYPDCQFVCIEPDPDNFQLLSQNILLNQIVNCKLVNKALWTEQAVLKLHSAFRDGDAWAKSVVPTTTEKIKAFSVESYTMQELLDEFKEFSIFIFKIDIEGAESYLFASDKFLQQIKHCSPHIIMEIHDEFDLRKSIYDKLIEREYLISEFDDVTLFTKVGSVKKEVSLG